MNIADSETALAAATLDAWDRGAPIDRSAVASPTSVEQALARQARINALREARGERPVGYKIGFTNRSIWPIYDVHHPIWAPVWDTTLTLLDSTRGEIALQRFAEPRLEPEIVFAMAGTPASSDPQAIFDAIDWIAHGFEIVQSPYPGWKFSAPEAIAAQSLHGALLVGPRKPRSIVTDWQALASLHLSLSRDGSKIADGSADLVLDNPVIALGHLVDELAAQGRRLLPGDIITTGTLTDAQQLVPGQRWKSTITGAALDGLELQTR